MFSSRSLVSRSILTLLVLAAPTVAQAPDAYQPRTLTLAEVAQDIALLRQALEQIHAGYDRYAPRRVMDAAFARLDRRAATPMTDLELYREVSLLLARIRCNHTKAEYPAALERWREQHATHLPVRVRVFGKRMFVAESAANNIARGTEITSINGVSAPDIVTKLSRYVAVDGFTDFARTALLERDGDLMRSDLDHYWPVEFGFASEWKFALKDAQGAERVATLPPITYASWKALAGETSWIDFGNGTSWRMLDRSTALLTIRSFLNYRKPIDAESTYRAIFSRLRAQRFRHLVLDLRENGCGSDDAAAGLLRYLADAPVQPLRSVRRRTIKVDPSLRSAFDAWGDPAEIFAPAESLFVKVLSG